MIAQLNDTYLRIAPRRVLPRLFSYFFIEGRPLTTKGRWLNPFVFFMLSVLRALPVRKVTKPPVFIVGIGRSGTTALGIGLSTHRQVAFLNEPKAVWAHLLDCEDLIGSYNKKPALYQLNRCHSSDKMRRDINSIYYWYSRICRSDQVVDKYPELVFRVPFVFSLFPNAKFIFISRSGFDTAKSIARWSKNLQSGNDPASANWWGEDDKKWKSLITQILPQHQDLFAHITEIRNFDDFGRGAVEWVVSMRAGLNLAAQHPHVVLHVPYKKLCEAPLEWAERLRNFVGLEHDPKFDSYMSSQLKSGPDSIYPTFPGWLAGIVDSIDAEIAALELAR